MNQGTLRELESFLKTEGLCTTCNQWVVLTPQSAGAALSNHMHGGKKCPQSGYSADDHRYVVANAEDAQRLAKVITEDHGECLSGFSGGHSLACGDGSHCHATRRRLAKALARFVIKHP